MLAQFSHSVPLQLREQNRHRVGTDAIIAQIGPHAHPFEKVASFSNRAVDAFLLIATGKARRPRARASACISRAATAASLNTQKPPPLSG